jgi:hypothetical protein
MGPSSALVPQHHFGKSTIVKLSEKLRRRTLTTQIDKSHQSLEMASRPTVTILSADGTASGATHPLPKVRIDSRIQLHNEWPCAGILAEAQS